LQIGDNRYVSTQFLDQADASRQTNVRERSAQATGNALEITASALNVRSQPNLARTVLRPYQTGDVVETTGKTRNGFVELTDGSWIAADFTTPAKPGARKSASPRRSLTGEKRTTEKETKTTPDATDATQPELDVDSVRNQGAGSGAVNTQVGRIAVYNSPNGQIVGTLQDGAEVLLSGKREGDWVQLDNGNWVSSDFVAEVQPSEPRVTPN
jgi:hypothetical protein